MRDIGEKTRFGIYVKYITGDDEKHWFPSDRKRNAALEEFKKETGPDKLYHTVWKCSK